MAKQKSSPSPPHKSKAPMGGLVRKRRRSQCEPADEKPKRAKVEERSARRTRRNSYESDTESSRDSIVEDTGIRTRRNRVEVEDREISFNLAAHRMALSGASFADTLPRRTADTLPRRTANTLLRGTPALSTAQSVEPTVSGMLSDTSSPTKTAGTAVQSAKKVTIKPSGTDHVIAEEEIDERETNRRSPNGFLLPDPLPKGEILTDSLKQEWVLGKAIGVGGFGELYLAACRAKGRTSPEHFVIKIEPHSNGPLFVEVHFYIRSTKSELLNQFQKDHNLRHLGVPRYIASGTHLKGDQMYRFLVMDRFGSDLQRILDNSDGGRLTDKTVCEVGLQVLDSLQYIHSQGYVHKDIKASNLLVGLGMEGQHKVHLVDYGLCSRYTVGSIHKQYVHDLRWAHEGTLEYTSRDSHIGCSSRRGDVEVLLYNLIEWWGGSLPWDRDFASPDIAKTAKFRAFANPHKFLRHCFRRSEGKYPGILGRMMRYISSLRFEQEPDYHLLRGLIRQEMKELGLEENGRLEFKLGRPCPLPDTETEHQEYLRPSPPETRVSTVFDKLCVSSRSWEQAREELWTRRSRLSLANPTPAMLDVMARSRAKEKEGNVANNRKRYKSGPFFGDWGQNTPAMTEVINMIKQKDLEGGAVVPPSSASLLPASSLLRISPIPPEVVSPPALLDPPTYRGEKVRPVFPTRKLAWSPTLTPSPRSKARSRELLRLDPFLEDSDSLSRRRTRSAEVPDSEVARNLRSAFRFGLGNMRTFLRQVSDSFTNIF